MEENKDEKQLQTKADEIVDAKTDKTETPLEEIKRLNTETKDLVIQLKKDKEELENAKEMMEAKKAIQEMKGTATAGQKPLTQEDVDTARADEILKRLS